MAPILQNLIFFPPSNLLVTAMSAANVLAMANAGYGEMRGTKHMPYSKFSHTKLLNTGGNAGEEEAVKAVVLSGRRGMLVAYTPALLVGLASLALFPDEGLRFLLVRSTLTLHFLKRTLEVLFIHKYSGGMPLGTATTIGTSYLVYTSTLIYAQHLSMSFSEPPLDLTHPGILLFLTGIVGNFYHHYLLSKLRTKTSKDEDYKVPSGGLFGLVICPHYLFEILVFWGFAFTSQTLFGFSMAIGTTFYLMGRSYATRRWYLSKFDDLSKDVKAIIPFVF